LGSHISTLVCVPNVLEDTGVLVHVNEENRFRV